VYSVGFEVIAVEFAGALDVVGLFAVRILLGFIVVKAMGIFGPGGNVELDAA
jgi:hypothetical protein